MPSRRSQPRTLLSLLRKRETNPSRTLGGAYLSSRDAYAFIHPDQTLHNVSAPHCVFRKFTPDGKYLVSFSKNLHSLQLFEFKGSSATDHLASSRSMTDYGPKGAHSHTRDSQEDPADFLPNCSPESVDEESEPEVPADEEFKTFFEFAYEIPLTFGAEMLNKDFCLFTNDGKYVILASAVSSFSPVTRKYPHSLDCLKALDDITFWLINIECAFVCDKLVFSQDYIILNNHSGVQLRDDILAITSVQNQSIHFVHVNAAGRFVMGRTVGWHNSDDDELPLAQLRSNEFRWLMESKGVPRPLALPSSRRNANSESFQSSRASSRWSPISDHDPRSTYDVKDIQHSPPFSGLKQRFMAFLYRKVSSSGSPRAMRHFYLTFEQFSSLLMWRMQFLSDDHILIKFGALENVLSKTEPALSQSCFFVVFALESSEILEVYENSSDELLDLYETWPQFRGFAFSNMTSYSSFPCNNEYSRDAFRKQMYTVRKARNGGATQSIRRVLSNLPLNPQSFIDTPFLDHSLYIFDEKVINNSDRGRLFGELPVKFWSRRTNQIKFKLDPNPMSQSEAPPPWLSRANRRYVGFIFHPFLPFAISVMVIPPQPSTVVNFHVRFGHPVRVRGSVAPGYGESNKRKTGTKRARQ
ncbi:De-etiolated protein 1 Det1-domain-containing protein [Zopfochytrium polystomum]|nr:De-etiolated protein 1 Det1-domain-containing protein [Zopfochytrium polystomum]